MLRRLTVKVAAMPILCRCCLLLCLAVSSATSLGADVQPAAATRSDTLAPEHARSEETAQIRKHHLNRLNDRLTQEPAVLKETCKYESEIATRPPAKRVVLSFDDGPDPGQTPFILETLQKRNIQAAFFMIGSKARQYPQLVEQIRAGGHHLIGNHSWDHPNFHDISVAEQAGEVLRNDALVEKSQPTKFFRYPYGNSTCATNALLHSHNYRIVGWHVDSCDWAFDRTGSVDVKEALSCGVLAHNRNDFVEHVVATVRGHNGGIVLLHEIHPNTLKKLDQIIGRLLDEGYVFGALDDADFMPSLR